jgi:hypothetical protein
MTKTTSILASAVMAASALAGTPVVNKNPVAPECDISYRNLTLSWIHNDGDLPGVDASDGVALRLEYNFIDRLYIAAGGSWSRQDTIAGDSDVWSGSLGLGYAIEITSCIHFVAEAGGVYVDGDVDSEGAFYASPHFRADLGPVEVHLGATYTSFDDSENDWVGFGRAFIPVHDRFDIAVGGSVGEDIWGVSAGVRVRF